MKNLILFSAFIFCLAVSTTIAQTTPRKSFSRKGYQAWVKLTDSRIVHGLLWNVDSSFVEIKTDQSKKWKSPESKAPLLKIPVEKIQSIRTKKVHAVLKGYGWGAIIGNGLGFAVAIPLEISEPDEGYMLIVPMMGLAGSFTGLIAGSLPDRTFKVEGNSKNYVSILPDLSKRAFWKW
ncbi:MAG: hypothetical protein LPK25_09425 [Cyclobacteriaceae bacterium]|nr:hypothetical protein [Cyclobacteriaceae bacterium]MDX5466821.1 hypothetical protein [Cyclobacteriaceae bacterium]